jgi:HpcH/HpaI aldolase/citrate lyase family
MLRRACTLARTHALPKSWFSSAASTNVAARPMRSVLYTPGSSKHLLKARTSSADCSLIDLEDGVAPSAKLRARKAVLDVVSPSSYTQHKQQMFGVRHI